MFTINDKLERIQARKAESARLKPRKAYYAAKNAVSNMEKRQAEIKASYEKSLKLRSDYANFQKRRIHNVVKGILPEGARHA